MSESWVYIRVRELGLYKGRDTELLHIDRRHRLSIFYYLLITGYIGKKENGENNIIKQLTNITQHNSTTARTKVTHFDRT